MPLFGAGAYDVANEREDIPFEEQLRALDKVVKAGKVSLGCLSKMSAAYPANITPEGWVGRIGMGRPVFRGRASTHSGSALLLAGKGNFGGQLQQSRL